MTLLLNSPFTLYCETQRKWAETDAVRDREYEGDVYITQYPVFPWILEDCTSETLDIVLRARVSMSCWD
jgi:hypothetical protein